MPLSFIPAWKEAPFLRLLLPFIAGILLQWYLQPQVSWSWAAIAATSAALLVLHTAPTLLRFKLQYVTGILINLLIIACGALVSWHNHPAHSFKSLTQQYSQGQMVKAVLQEPLSQKKNSYKAVAAVRQLYDHNNIIEASGNITVYFSHSVNPREISYGSIIIINKPLQPVKSWGNPGAFDYKRYCTFNNIGFQVFLQPGEFSVLAGKETRGLKRFIFYCRARVINIVRTYIKGEQEAALAEALLIGYKDELDKNLVQA